MRLGNPRFPHLHFPCLRPFMCSGPRSASSATAIFIPCSFQSTALLGDMGQQEGPRLYPSKSRLALPTGPLAEMESAMVTRPHSVCELACDPPTR